MEITTSIVVQATLLGLSLLVTILRCWVRLRLENRTLMISDYLIWGGWGFSVGWAMCSIKTLKIQIDHPLDPEDMTSDSVAYLKVRGVHTPMGETVFLACYFFDIGLYFPKGSIVAFYWWLIAPGFRRLRIALYVVTAYLVSALVASILTDTLMTRPITDNWSVENQFSSIWNSYTNFAVNWTLNFSNDLLLFCLPFFVIKRLKLSQRQKIGLIGIFSVGLITMTISLARFLVYTITDYTIDDASGNAWCTAEMCTAVIVASLPGLKRLTLRGEIVSDSHEVRSSHGYVKPRSALPISTSGTSRTYIQGGEWDDNLELVFLDRESLPCPAGRNVKDAKNCSIG